MAASYALIPANGRTSRQQSLSPTVPHYFCVEHFAGVVAAEAVVSLKLNRHTGD